MKTAQTAEKLARQQSKRQKEICRWEKEKARPRRNIYFIYLVFIIALIYATDEIASQIGTLMKTEIANDLFNSEKSVGLLDMLSIFAIPFQAIGLLYRPLADRWGRKTFLIINTFGMSFALLIIYLSNNIPLYVVGSCLIQFFVPHDMHVVYIMESSPSKHRARIYSSIKFFANIAVILVPMLRDKLMESGAQWRNVYLIPAIVGMVSCFIALLTARETDAFIDSRLRYLRMSDEERAAEKEKNKKPSKKLDAANAKGSKKSKGTKAKLVISDAQAQNAQGGLITALKFALKHKQLRWLYITSAFVNIGFIGTINYQVILSYGYAGNLVKLGNFAELGKEALEFVSTGVVTDAIFLFPIGCAVSQVIMGFISDSLGRKAAAITTAFNCLLSFILFWVGANFAWMPYIVGFFCGAFVGSYYSTNDVLIMMVGESSPTNLRSSCMSAQFIVTALGYAFSYVVHFIVVAIASDKAIAVESLSLLVPGLTVALIAMMFRTHDTKGINMDTVTGCEWD